MSDDHDPHAPPLPPVFIPGRTLRARIEVLRMEYPEDQFDLVLDVNGWPTGVTARPPSSDNTP